MPYTSNEFSISKTYHVILFLARDTMYHILILNYNFQLFFNSIVHASFIWEIAEIWQLWRMPMLVL